MRTSLLVVSLLCLLGGRVYAQHKDEAKKDEKKETFDDLKLLYMDEKYDKLIKKGEKYTEDDKTRHEPLPYLYLAKAYYEISKNPDKYGKDFRPDQALRYAFRYAERYRRYDPDGTLYADNEIFFEELKQTASEQGENSMMEKNWSHARRYYESIIKFDPQNVGAWMLYGYCKLQDRDRSGEDQIKKASNLADSVDLKGAIPIDKKLAKSAFENYATYLKSNGMADSARTVISYGYPAFKDDKEFMLEYNELK